MNDMSCILSIDQGTSGTKAVIFNASGEIVCQGRSSLESSYPVEGYVEQDPYEIMTSVLVAVRCAVDNFTASGRDADDIACCGISNQRETFVLWEKNGTPLVPAVVWQCKRSISICREMKENNLEKIIRSRTGLMADPYFSGSKIIWHHRNTKSVKKSIDNGTALFGTVDTWLLYNLTNRTCYKTDYTNASRTMLFNLKDLIWDREIIKATGLEKLQLPEIFPSSSNFGESSFNGIFKKPIPITSMIGDSHAAAFGERCFTRGTAKATMGTGSSILLNTENLVDSDKTSMVPTICWSTEKQVCYALEGIIVSCASTLNWLSSQLGLFETSREADEIAMNMPDNGGVYLIPAFSGLGAPWWKMEEKARICGLTFDSDKRHIIRAGLESIAFQITDIMKAMEQESGIFLSMMNIDGGVSSSPFVTSMLASLNSTRINRCRLKEASALGAAFLAGLKQGIFSSIDDLNNLKYNDDYIESVQNETAEESYRKWIDLLEGLT